MYTQGASVLFDRSVAIERVEQALGSFEVVRRIEASEEWAFGGPGLLIAMRPEVNGTVVVDAVNRPWPDHMGDPQQEPMLFGAWSMGNFGPFAFPGNLERAGQHSWGWEEGKTIPSRHRGFIRIRTTYVGGGAPDALVRPHDYDPAPELILVTELARALLELPGALCYFNPNGESLRSAEWLDDSMRRYRDGGPLPLDVWCNIRLFNLGDVGWLMMDSVGMWQLDTPDHEACFPRDAYNCGEVDNFLRNAGWYLYQKGPVIKDGDTMDGPGSIRWQAKKFTRGLVPPPREVLRWLPVDGSAVPEALLSEPEDEK
jgi:hypothetical protein